MEASNIYLAAWSDRCPLLYKFRQSDTRTDYCARARAKDDLNYREFNVL